MATIDFDNLSIKAFASVSTMDDKSNLWQAVLQLKEWYFVMRGTLLDSHPYVAQANQIEPNTYWIYAFTDADRCTAFVKDNNLGIEGGNSLYLSIPNNEDMISYLKKFTANGVKGIYFNCNANGFYSPLEQLQIIKDYLKNNGKL